MIALVANTAGTLAAAGVAVATLRRRPLGNALVLGGIAAAALGSALTGLGVAESSALLLAAVALLYAGVVARR